MRPLSEQRPKALIPTLDIPQVSWHLASMAKAGIEEVWVNAHSHADLIREEAERVAEVLGLKLGFSLEEDAPLGTGGALHRLRQLTPGGPMVVVNADVACTISLEKLLQAHRGSGAVATVATIPEVDTADFVVEQGWVVDLIEPTDLSRFGHRFAGIRVFEEEVLDYTTPGPSSLLETVFTGLVADRKPVAAFAVDDYWLDVGTPLAHLHANLDALAGDIDFEDIHTLIGREPLQRTRYTFVGMQARVDDADLKQCVVGSRARIEPGSELQRCVVWDGVDVKAGKYSGEIITPKGAIKVE